MARDFGNKKGMGSELSHPLKHFFLRKPDVFPGFSVVSIHAGGSVTPEP